MDIINTRLQMQDLLCDIWTKMRTTVVFVTHDLTEAVYLADEICIMRANPGRIVEHMKVDLPMERERSLKRTAKFVDIVAKVEEAMIRIQYAMDQERNNGK